MDLTKQIEDCIERCNNNFDVAQSDGEAKYWEGCLNAYLNVLRIIKESKKVENEEFEPDEDYEEESQCNTCGLTDDHAIDCPNNNSPFVVLLRDGYD